MEPPQSSSQSFIAHQSANNNTENAEWKPSHFADVVSVTMVGEGKAIMESEMMSRE